VLNQGISAVEIVCVDDGSTDDTCKVIAQWQSDHPDVNCRLEKQLNSGACAARNKGIRASRGAYIQFLDADDILLQGKVKSQIAQLKKSANAAFVAGAFKRRQIDGKEVLHLPEQPGFYHLFTGKAGITSANLFVRKYVALVNGWNENLGSSQETDLMFRLLVRTGEYLISTEPLTVVRDRESGRISQSNAGKRVRNFLSSRAVMLDTLQSENPKEWQVEKSRFQSFFLSSVKIAEGLEKGTWYQFRKYFPERSEIMAIAGLSRADVAVIRMFGYDFFFLTMRLRRKPDL
jgi:glycosyltransferase involved in cell wall biosynthesis